VPSGISALTFADPLHGWAIDACVSETKVPSIAELPHCDILATNDGGQTWHVQRTVGGTQGAAVRGMRAVEDNFEDSEA
jgi:hypothetical protein